MKRIADFVQKRLFLLMGILLFTPRASLVKALDWTQEQSIPPWALQTFASPKLKARYEFSAHLNPFYLRGDFNGDRTIDLAILIKNKNSNKLGIAIIHGSSQQVFILGAGEKIKNGGDDFRWMDIWRIFEKGYIPQGAEGNVPPQLQGEALWVEKSEAASALLYWNGKGYSWYQQGD